MSIRLIAENGLPLKITAEWTDETYWNRRSNYNDDLDEVRVQGWLVRINGKKYPRDHTDGNGYPDWTYRYTTYGNTTDDATSCSARLRDQSAGFRR